MRQVGGFVECFSLIVLIIHSPKLTAATSGNHQADVGFTLGAGSSSSTASVT
jgi:hypothetical protein